MIRHTEVRLRDLKAAMDDAYKHRDVSPLHRESSKRACAAFHEYEAPIDNLLKACETQGIADCPDLRDFAFAFVEVAPYFCRSGYLMEYLLQHIKRLELSEPEKTILRTAILNRIERGARREFRHLCRTIPKIKNDSFENTLQKLADAKTKSIRDRAEIALSYL